MVLADGRLAKAGGRVVKNVAGYDLARLLCGSFGSLAVITSATFKLSPLPHRLAHVPWHRSRGAARRLAELALARRRARRSPLPPSSSTPPSDPGC